MFNVRQLARLAAAWTVLGVWSLAACEPGRQVEQSDLSLPLIYGGTAVEAGAWPSVVGLAYGATADGPFHLECTGTLIAPHVVLTAGHCLKNSTFDVAALGDAVQERLRIYTGLGVEGGQVIASHAVERAAYHPLLRVHPIGYGDLGVVILQAPIDAIDPVPLVKTLAGQRAANGVGAVTVLGYGRRDDAGQGVKYQVETTLRDATSNEAVTGGSGRDACAGDSGGPAFVQLPRADAKGVAWHQVGVVSRSLRLECGQGGYVALASDGICWIEQEAGVRLAGADTHCDWQAPSYDAADLSSVDFAALCDGTTGNDTQREAARHVRLALGAPSCADAAATLQASVKLTLDYQMLRDLSPLAGLPRLETLSLRGNRLTDLAPLTSLPALRELHIHGNDVQDLTALADQEAAGLLVLGKRRQLHNVTATNFLAACESPALDAAARRTVDVVKWKTMADSCALANERLLGMRTLALRDRGLTDVSPLAGLQQLTTLDLSQNPGLDIAPLASLEALKSLNLAASGITDLTPLAPLIARGLVVTGAP